MRSRLRRLALVTLTVCTVTACQTPNPEGAKKDAVDVKTPDAKTPDTKAVEPAPTTAVPGPPAAGTAADTAATAGTATASLTQPEWYLLLSKRLLPVRSLISFIPQPNGIWPNPLNAIAAAINALAQFKGLNIYRLLLRYRFTDFIRQKLRSLR